MASGPNSKKAAVAKPKKSANTKKVKTKTATAGGFARAADSGPSGPNGPDGN